MPNIDPAVYGWATRESSYEVAGCVTLVAGLDPDQALAVVGADQSPPLTEDSEAPVQDSLPTIAAIAAATAEPSAVLVEANGVEGSRPEALKALSKKGLAASAFWNVNGVVRFGCARRRKIIYTAELPDEACEGLPRALHNLAVAAYDDDADLVAIAIAMAVTYTGIELTATKELLRPSRLYPITNPVLGLPVTAKELVALQYPTPELLAAARVATVDACRRLMIWSVLDAVGGAQLGDYPAVAQIVNQLSVARPLVLPSAYIDFRTEVSRRSNVAQDAVQTAFNSPTTKEERAELIAESSAWGRRYWALQALLYAAVREPVTAALGATYCATIRYGLGSDEAAQFHGRALGVLLEKSNK